MKRTDSGGTLALVAICTVVIIIIGIAFFLYLQVFGGGNQLRNASDSGALAIAKTAIRHPGVPASSLQNEQKYNFSFLYDDPSKSVDPTLPANQDGEVIDLLSYNRLAAHVTLVCINALQMNPNGNDAPLALAHKNQLIDLLQGTAATSIGSRLKAALVGAAGLFDQEFGKAAKGNSLRMLGANDSVDHRQGDYAVAYVEQDGKAGVLPEHQATNIFVSANLSNQAFGPEFQDMLCTKNGRQFLRGYHVTAGVGVVGVPTQPGEQPHVISDRVFEDNRNLTIASVSVPPNAFHIVGEAEEKRTQIKMGATSAAIVGSRNSLFPLAFPYGYIEVVNGPTNHVNPTQIGPPFPNLDNVLVDELGAGGGIRVSNPVFSTDPGPKFDEWARHNYDVAKGNTPSTNPSPAGFYRMSDGAPASQGDCNSIQWEEDSNGQYLGPRIDGDCDDVNVHSGGGPCQQGYNGGNGPFATAYGNGYTTNSGGPASNLIAVECAKCKLQTMFNANPITLTVGLECNNGPNGSTGPVPEDNYGTGLRIFEHAGSLPSNQNPRCIISRPGSVGELCDMIDDGRLQIPTTDAFRFIFGDAGSTDPQTLFNRIRQMNPKTDGSDLDYNATWTKIYNGPYGGQLGDGKFQINSVAYIYFDNAGNLQFNYQPPPVKQLIGTQLETPDGVPRKRQHGPYGIVFRASNTEVSIVNPLHDNEIHDQLYQDGPDNGQIDAIDKVLWTPSSGFNNLLGRMQFLQTATGSAQNFSDPD